MAARHQYVLLGVHALIIYSFIATLGRRAARTYMNTLESFCFLLGSSIAMAQIQMRICSARAGSRRLIGARTARWASGLFTLSSMPSFCMCLLGLFTDDKTIIAIGASLLGMNLILQPGKMLNMALGNSLNAVGERGLRCTFPWARCGWSPPCSLMYSAFTWGGAYRHILLHDCRRVFAGCCPFRWRGQNTCGRQSESSR